jgi:hypothetical protein
MGIVAIGLSLGTMSASAQTDEDEGSAPTSTLYLDVGNPSPGDSVHVGRYQIEGIAFDRAADAPPGIDHIEIFIGDRDSGGMLIGRAALSASSLEPDDPSLAGSGWTAQVVLTRSMIGSRTMFFYALSGVTGEELVVGVPVSIVP